MSRTLYEVSVIYNPKWVKLQFKISMILHILYDGQQFCERQIFSSRLKLSYLPQNGTQPYVIPRIFSFAILCVSFMETLV